MTPTDPQVPVKALLRVPKLWLMPALLSALLAIVLSLVYMGGVVNPTGNLKHLPIAIVNADQGHPLPGQQQNLGTQITQSLTADTSRTVDWRVMAQAQAQEQMDSGKVYGALSIPADFTDSVATLVANTATARPTLTVLTNPGTGSLGSSLAQAISTQAAQQASMTLGSHLVAAAGPHADAATKLLLADPAQITTQAGHPLGQHSGLGLTAFYYALVIVMIGFLAANVIQSGVDSGLGYADTELGPWHRRRPTVAINRTRTLLLKMVMAAALTAVTVTLVMVSAIGILGIDASHLPLLWIFSYCAALAVSLGALAIYAAFGGIGQLVALIVFVVMGLPSSGLTIPLQAVPGFYRFLSLFEPMHQLADGVRSILYFDARGDAGLTHAWIMIAIGVVLALVFGFAMTRYYDRKGLRRLVPQPAPSATPDVPS